VNDGWRKQGTAWEAGQLVVPLDVWIHTWTDILRGVEERKRARVSCPVGAMACFHWAAPKASPFPTPGVEDDGRVRLLPASSSRSESAE